jgi:hypothetical protein
VASGLYHKSESLVEKNAAPEASDLTEIAMQLNELIDAVDSAEIALA